MTERTSMEPVRTATHRVTDVLKFIIDETEKGARCVLVTIAHVEGSSPRAVGSLMGVSDRGFYVGNVSNGCVDADIALQALDVLDAGAPRRVRYGVGSPYFDIKLPCGGAIDVVLTPISSIQELAAARAQLENRQAVGLAIESDAKPFVKAVQPIEGCADNVFYYAPALHISIAGNGEETIALASLAVASAYDASVYSTERRVLDAVEALGARSFWLDNPASPPALVADGWSALVCLFHDHDLELGLIQSALHTDNFYIGAMGSARTHAARLEALRQAGTAETALQRIRGPIGLIPSTRDAARLAISTLAEIASLYRARP